LGRPFWPGRGAASGTRPARPSEPSGPWAGPRSDRGLKRWRPNTSLTAFVLGQPPPGKARSSPWSKPGFFFFDIRTLRLQVPATCQRLPVGEDHVADRSGGDVGEGGRDSAIKPQARRRAGGEHRGGLDQVWPGFSNNPGEKVRGARRAALFGGGRPASRKWEGASSTRQRCPGGGDPQIGGGGSGCCDPRPETITSDLAAARSALNESTPAVTAPPRYQGADLRGVGLKEPPPDRRRWSGRSPVLQDEPSRLSFRPAPTPPGGRSAPPAGIVLACWFISWITRTTSAGRSGGPGSNFEGLVEA